MLTDRRRRLLLAGGLLGAFLLLYAASNLTAAGQLAENTLLRAHDGQRFPAGWLDADGPVPPFVLAVPTLVAGTALAAGIAAVRRRPRELAVVLLATPLAVAASQTFKQVAGRPHLVRSTLDTDVSYPSGHAAIAFAVTAALLVVVPESVRRWVAPILIGWSALVGAALQAVGEHRSSEVLGSGLLVAAVFVLAGAVAVPRADPPRRRPSPAVVLVAVVLAALGAANTLPWAAVLYAVVALLAAGCVTAAAPMCRWAPEDPRPPAPLPAAQRV